MNLAEIRKKAHREKSGETLPSAPASTSRYVSERAGGDEPAERESVPEVDKEVPPGAASDLGTKDGAFVEEPPEESVEEFQKEAPVVFDPLAVILSGRRAAGTASDAVDAPRREAFENEGGGLKYLRFRVADEEYGVSLLDIREIIKPRDITEVPRMPDFVAGILSLRGIIIPVFDLRLRLGLSANGVAGRERIIIAKKQEGSVGLLVDEVYQVINLSAPAIEKAPAVLEGIDREFVSGIGRYGRRMLILLDLEKIIDISLR